MPDPRITQLLHDARGGDQEVVDRLMGLIYEELRSLARRHMRSERSGHTLQATALVHEAYLRLVGSDSGPWKDRQHFFAVAATVVRRLLVEHARARSAAKRAGDRERVQLSDVEVASADADERVLAVDEALRRLHTLDAQQAEIVELRHFGGLSVEETAEALGISARTVARDWSVARAWLSVQLDAARDTQD